MNRNWIIIFISFLAILIIGLATYGFKCGFRKYYTSLEPNSFDDQYMGCENDMMKNAQELLAKERKRDSQLNDVWVKAEKRWVNKISKITEKRIEKLFEIAVVAYTDTENGFFRKFNEAVRICCQSREDYINNFHFKAFHFYLTRAVQLLGGKCIPVYRGINLKFYPGNTEGMRFGGFASSSKNISVAKYFAKSSGTLYNLTTCLGAPIQHLSYNESENEVLIPPYEVFTVSTFEPTWCGLNIIHLKPKNTCSNFNCIHLRGEKINNCPSNSVPGNIPAWLRHLTPLPLFGIFILLLQKWIDL